jgi:hypothetical protein
MEFLLEEVKAAQGPKWHRPNIAKGGDEYGEITRTRRELRLKSAPLHTAMAKGRLGTLSDKHWSRMDNTDSWKATKASANKLAKEYGRDIKRVHTGFKEGHKMPAPIVLHRKGKRPYLVGGNTRLMAASATGIRPKVFHVRIK